jgi:hypothetical protein
MVDSLLEKTGGVFCCCWTPWFMRRGTDIRLVGKEVWPGPTHDADEDAKHACLPADLDVHKNMQELLSDVGFWPPMLGRFDIDIAVAPDNSFY